jgi:serine phosphatase RsbU (regulator of sigma subunit)
VGGDFYDVIPLNDGRVLLALGDVAGKGSPAALLMALLLAMMRTLVDEGCSSPPSPPQPASSST